MLTEVEVSMMILTLNIELAPTQEHAEAIFRKRYPDGKYLVVRNRMGFDGWRIAFSNKHDRMWFILKYQ